MNAVAIIESMVSGALGALVYQWLVLGNFNRQRIATVNINEIISSHINQQGEHLTAEKERSEKAQEFDQKIKAKIKELQVKENIILLVAPAVVSELPDYTEELKQQLL